jgi:enoyl-CoA hydratase
MTFQTLICSDHGAIRLITLNRPEKLNALNRATLEDLHGAFDNAANDAKVRAVVLRGAGEKAFVAGADIAEFSALSPVEALAFSRLGQQLMLKIEHLGKPVIAQLQGFALGGGMELAMACHLRIAGEKVKLGQPEIKLGLLPGFGGTQRLLRLAGRSAALELCLLGEPIDAQRALALGLVTRVVPQDQLESETMATATRLAESAPHALRGILDALIIGGECGLQQGLDYESQAFAVCFSTEDMREGAAAFLARRPAQFVGK